MGNLKSIASLRLFGAIKNGETETALELIDDISIQKSINQLYYNGKIIWGHDYVTCLFMACLQNNLTVVKKILKVPGLKVNTKNYWSKETALHAACQAGSSEIVKLLVENGAMVTEDVIATAQKYQRSEIVSYLKQISQAITVPTELLILKEKVSSLEQEVQDLRNEIKQMKRALDTNMINRRSPHLSWDG